MPRLPIKIRRLRTIQPDSALRLPFPIHGRIRFAQLCERAPALGSLKPFRPESPIHLQGFCPNIVAGTAPELLRLAEEIDLGTVYLASLSHAAVVITFCGQLPIGDTARVILWQAFGVPVYEVFCGHDATILGYECELHEGWHLSSEVHLSEYRGELMLRASGVSGLHTGLTGSITAEACPCGRPGPRLLNVEPARRSIGYLQRAASA